MLLDLEPKVTIKPLGHELFLTWSIAVECGSVTSLAVSADHSTLAVGHATGHIFTWELGRSARPFLHIAPIVNDSVDSRKSDGHLANAAVLHVGFLGTRHTALVSADDRGMAFSHLATRGMGAVGRTVRTTRILGRYPDVLTRSTKPRKPSSVLAFSPLPLGNIAQPTDTMGLVAMLTPYLLVIVSTTPVAQTQYKAARPKDMAAHGAMSAALAWFPAIKLKAKEVAASKTKLVYCWSNVLSVLEIGTLEHSGSEAIERPLELSFSIRSKWKAEEAIVAVQWISRSVLAVLTITQQLHIIEDTSMRVTDSFDLLQKRIYHTDLFSKQLHSLVEALDEEDSSMHGIVADAFYMSFRGYKGRLFLLGLGDVSIGGLTNWADRLMAMIEAGDFIGAIRLAASYFDGEGEKLTIGLPEDDNARHSVVGDKLHEIMSASLRYAFGPTGQAPTDSVKKTQLSELAEASLLACASMQDQDFLFEEVFPAYEDGDAAPIFLDALEPYIASGEINSLPPLAVKCLIDHYRTNHTPSALEETICQLDPSTMDIEQVTNLCKKYNLYDAYIYVWTQTMKDFQTPLDELLQMTAIAPQSNEDSETAAIAYTNASKIFPYLSYILTGRIYPTGDPLAEAEAIDAKMQIYTMLFINGSAQLTGLPKISRESDTTSQRSFGSLRAILIFDCSSFMSVLNEAFEDSFLNDLPEQQSNGTASPRGEQGSKRQSINRQYLVNVLLRIMTTENFSVEDTVYLDIFLARNLPKYPQYIMLSGAILHQVVARLCDPPNSEMREECQLSLEYLLSVYHPPDIQQLVPLFRKAQFYRVLKSIYRSEHQYAQWIDTFFLDEEDQDTVFSCIEECLQDGSSLTTKQRRDVQAMIRTHVKDLIHINVRKAAEMAQTIAPDLHDLFLKSMEGDSGHQYEYLNALLEPSQAPRGKSLEIKPIPRQIELYVQLMCQFDPTHVPEYVEVLNVGELNLEPMLSAIEAGGIVDAAVVLMARQGQVTGAIERLVGHLQTLEAALRGLLQDEDANADEIGGHETMSGLLVSIGKYVRVGIWLCQGRIRAASRTKGVREARGLPNLKQSLSFEESLWLDLINAIVNTTSAVSITSRTSPDANRSPKDREINTTTSLRNLVQEVFTALLGATTSSKEDLNDMAFLRIFRTFLTQAASTSSSIAELRAVLSSIFTAYAHEESFLDIANSMLDKDLFIHVDEVTKLRQRGWRPRGQACEICRKRIWGPGAGSKIWEAWQRKQDSAAKAKTVKEAERNLLVNGTGKGKAAAQTEVPDLGGADARAEDELGPVVVFTCRHIVHRKCLGLSPKDGEGTLVCPICT